MSVPSKDKPAEIEKFGIEHIPEGERHGSPNRQFTLWFAANLTVADYVIGVLCVLVFGLSVSQAIPVLILGNVLGGAYLGLSAAMGPTLGFPQMFSSRSSFGRRGNYVLGSLNWVSTVGWFAVNTILAVEAALVLVPGLDFIAVAIALVAVQAAIAVYGHDFIQLFEKVMSVVLGVLFLWLFILTIPHLGQAFAYSPGTETGAALLGSAGTVLAVSFSYIMSWSPYASDYSRYLPSTSSKRRIVFLTMAGGAAASFAIELLGAIIGAITRNSSDYFGALYKFAGSSGGLAMLAIVLGAMAANALNIYTNSLSALVLDVKAERWTTVLVGAVVGLLIAEAAGTNFVSFFQNFLLALDYWITPWLAIILVDFYLMKRTSVASSTYARPWNHGTLAIYGLSILVSVPFMVPAIQLGFPVGSLSSVFGGADFSYFISFGVAGVLEYLYLRRINRWTEIISR